MSLYAVFEEAARGKLPPQDGRVEVCGTDAGKAAAAALGLLPAGTPVFAQVAPGNSVSLRATLAAGYAPVGGEVLLPRQP